jgi:hypothetical protein
MADKAMAATAVPKNAAPFVFKFIELLLAGGERCH